MRGKNHIRVIGSGRTAPPPLKKSRHRGVSSIRPALWNRPTGGTQSSLSFLQRRLLLSPKYVQDAIEIDGRIKHGNPVFKGTRVPVYLIVEELADGTTLEDILEGYPTIDAGRIKAGLDFVASLTHIYDDQVSD